jgi:hypothetical protein
MFLSITESKKVVAGDEFAPQVVFEKHKIFLYREDFAKFVSGLNEMIQYIEDNQEPFIPYYNKEEGTDDEATLNEDGNIKIDIDF